MQKCEAEGSALAMPEVIEELGVPEMAPKALAAKDSIQENVVVCLECGAEMRQLTSKHLVSHGLDQKQYRKKYGFTMRTPLAAKSLTKARSKAAKKRGLPEKLKTYIEARRREKVGPSARTAATETVTASKPKRTRLRKKGVS